MTGTLDPSIGARWSLDEHEAAWRAVAEARGTEQRRAALEKVEAIMAARLEFPLPGEPVE